MRVELNSLLGATCSTLFDHMDHAGTNTGTEVFLTVPFRVAFLNHSLSLTPLARRSLIGPIRIDPPPFVHAFGCICCFARSFHFLPESQFKRHMTRCLRAA